MHKISKHEYILLLHIYKSCEYESRSSRGVLDTILCDKVCQWLAADRWFFPGIPVSSTNKTDHHDIKEILLKVNWQRERNKKTKQWSTEHCAENPSFFSNTNPTKTETLHVITLYWKKAHDNDPRVALSRESVWWLRVEVMVFNATFSNISFISD
jgi:hypothetical protein